MWSQNTDRWQAAGREAPFAHIEKTDGERLLTTVDPQDRSTWRSGVRSAMRVASQLHGMGPTDVDDAPAPAVLHCARRLGPSSHVLANMIYS